MCHRDDVRADAVVVAPLAGAEQLQRVQAARQAHLLHLVSAKHLGCGLNLVHAVAHIAQLLKLVHRGRALLAVRRLLALASRFVPMHVNDTFVRISTHSCTSFTEHMEMLTNAHERMIDGQNAQERTSE